MKTFILALSLMTGIGAQADDNNQWFHSKDPQLIKCFYAWNSGGWDYQVTVVVNNAEVNLYRKNPETSKSARLCSAAVAQAELDKTGVYVNMATGEVLPENGFATFNPKCGGN